jgi:uncharacterized protein YukJ
MEKRIKITTTLAVDVIEKLDKMRPYFGENGKRADLNDVIEFIVRKEWGERNYEMDTKNRDT